MRIYLADLGHNQVTVTSDVYPLGVASIATYAQTYCAKSEPIEARIFREPQALKTALDRAPPDILGFSSYSWNHRLSVCMARYAKARTPDVLTVMGGPNFPLEADVQESWVRSQDAIDVFVRGPTYEGERAFLNLLERYIDIGASIEGLWEAPIAANIYVNRRTGAFVHGGDIDRIRDLDEIPSPYLAGLMDPFFETGYFPLLQIARGCPFGCTFCNSSVTENNRISAHSVANVCQDLVYIAQRVKPEVTLCFADDNFGMYPRDEEIADYLGHLQQRRGWPRYIRTTTGKNRSERIIRVIRKTNKALPMTAAVQSLNPKVLANIKRDNISLDTYRKIQDEVREQGMQSYGELILCLPGETRSSVMDAVRRLLDSGVHRVSAHQLMLLHGAPLANPASRKRFGFQTRHRLVARCLGDYTGQVVAETEEMVVESSDFSFQDYLDVRVFHLLLTIYYYEDNFEEAFQFARQHNVEPFDLVVALQRGMDQAPPAFREMVERYVRENREELFDTPEACAQWARDHFQELVTGELGGNLLSKYSMIGRFYTVSHSLEYLRRVLMSMVGANSGDKATTDPAGGDKATTDPAGGGAPVADMLDSVIAYLRCVLLHAPFARTVEQTPDWVTRYDVEAWRNEGYHRGLSAYRLDHTRRYATYVEPSVKKLILSRINGFGEHPAGLGRFTRTMFARDLRRRLRYHDARQTRRSVPV